jgi:ribosomal protein L11 methyltransferase
VSTWKIFLGHHLVENISMTMPETVVKEDPTDMATLCQAAIDMVAESDVKLTPRALEKKLQKQLAVSKKAFKSAVEHLIADGRLIYTYRFGCSFLETSYNRPVRISEKITLTPPALARRLRPGEIMVKLQPGASFGMGDHPSTRLAVKGIEYTLTSKGPLAERNDVRALDIGTGSGILAITAVLLGAKTAVGIDIDPCAVSEAKQNVAINHLENQVDISARTPAQIDSTFSLIIANLRYPTLKRLRAVVAQKTEKSGVLVISGIRTDEISELLQAYARIHCQCVWQKIEKGWGGLVLVKI